MGGGGLGGELPPTCPGVARACWPLVARLPHPAGGRAAIISSPAVVSMTENPRTGRLRPLLSGVVLRSQSDERLSALASAGNEAAFTAIYERYRRELGSHARRIVRPDRADDVVQHAMLAAWSALLAGAEISDLRAWLHRVVHNAALDTVSRRGYDDGAIPDSSIALSGTEELAEGRLSAALALAAIAALPESQRRALTLTAIEGRSGHEAAVEMGISESAMRQLVYRARSGVRGAVTAVTPLPLINWLLAAGGAPATPAVVGLGVTGGGAATVAKIAAVLGVTAATLGATHALQGDHQHRHTRNIPASQAVTTTTEGGGHTNRLEVQQASVTERPTPATNHAAGQLAGEQHRNGGQNGSSQQSSSNNAGHQSGSQRATGGTGNQQSGRQHQSGPAQPQTQAAPSVTSNGSGPQQSGQGNGGTSSGQSGSSPSPPPQNGQSTNGH